MKINIKTRLFLYNMLIIIISSLLIIFMLTYIYSNSKDVLYNINSVTIDENVNAVKNILAKTDSYQWIELNIKKYNYSLSIYENNKLIYGNENRAILELLDKTKIRKNEIRTLFLDNTTTVMKSDGKLIYFAIHEKNPYRKENSLFNYQNPFHNMIAKIIVVILIVLLLIIILAILFSNRIIKEVLKPVKLLKTGAKRVQKGNYNEPIIYENEDEFSSVINNFNGMQNSLKEKTEKAIDYEKAKKEMINGISHDIRTPLTVVKGNIKGIRDGVANTKEKRNKYLDIAYNRVIDIENMLNRLFDTYNYETEEFKLNKEEVLIGDFIKEIINNNENIINKVIDCKFECLNLDLKYTLDKTQFKRVFDNLINNAIKYNKEKEHLKINIKIWQENKLIKISFKDNGKGVKEENIKMLFDEFFKEDTSRNGDKNSLGLGLFIVKKIIESHKGTIIAQNRNGLYFEITLKGDKNE